MREYTIPFVLHERQGEVKIEYAINKSIVHSGMDLFTGMGFDVAVCLGYPTIYGKVTYEGSGYRMGMYWVQLVQLAIFDTYADTNPQKVETIIDGPPELRGKVPFFAGGPCPSFYDAPSFAKVFGEKVVFKANTYLVTPPGLQSGETKRLCGFSWGHIEDNQSLTNRKIKILPLRITGEQPWQKDSCILNSKYAEWKFT